MTIIATSNGYRTYTLTDEHAACSHGFPVLVDERGRVYAAYESLRDDDGRASNVLASVHGYGVLKAHWHEPVIRALALHYLRNTADPRHLSELVLTCDKLAMRGEG